MLKIERSVFEQMTTLLQSAFPHEGCGLMLGTTDGQTRTVTQIVAAKNLNAERAHDRYELDPAAWLDADEVGRATKTDVVGIYHSHPDHPSQASQTDLNRAWAGYSYLIVSIRSAKRDTYQSWILNDDHFDEESVEVIDGNN